MFRVLLVEDHLAFRQPLAYLLRLEPEISDVQQAGSLAEARPLLGDADVAVFDLHLPDGDGLDLVREYLHRKPGGSALVLSGSSDEVKLAQAVEAGASAVLEKTAGIDQVFEAVRKLSRGEPVMTARQVIEMLRIAGQARDRDAAAQSALASLTPREREVLQELADGLSDKEIASRLGVTADTARNHVANVLAKLGVESRLQAVLFAIRHGAVAVR